MIIVIFGGKCGHYYVVQTFYATFILHTFTLSGNNAQWSVELDSPTEHAGKVGRRHCRVPSTLEACVLVRVLQTRPQCRAHTHRASERTGFRDWLVLLGAAQCELLSEGGRLEAWPEVARWCCRERQASFHGAPPLFLAQPLTDWTKPTHIMEGSLLRSGTTGFNVNHI